MTEHLDQKQIKIVSTWIGISQEYAAENLHQYEVIDFCRSVPQADNYTAFIAMWVALNALCNALYYDEANRLMAEICTKRRKTKAWIEGTGARANGDWTSIRDTSKCDMDITRQSVFGLEKLKLRIKEKYTEDIIYDEFAKAFSSEYQSWMKESRFRECVLRLRNSLIKQNQDIPYVVNMARKRDYERTGEAEKLKEMHRRRIVVIFDDENKLQSLKDVLYQVRCNIFHGEKSPGDPNDDRIVLAAYPVLSELMKRVSDKLGIVVDQSET